MYVCMYLITAPNNTSIIVVIPNWFALGAVIKQAIQRHFWLAPWGYPQPDETLNHNCYASPGGPKPTMTISVGLSDIKLAGLRKNKRRTKNYIQVPTRYVLHMNPSDKVNIFSFLSPAVLREKLPEWHQGRLTKSNLPHVQVEDPCCLTCLHRSWIHLSYLWLKLWLVCYQE